MTIRLSFFGVTVLNLATAMLGADDLRPVSLQSRIDNVQPMTGIVLWSANEAVASSPIQLEYAYFRYDQVVGPEGTYDWQVLETHLNEVASRKHQAIIRWHDTYVGRPTGVPTHIKQLSDYTETIAKSEKKETGFPDWSHPKWQAFVLDFMEQFSKRYDGDRRLAFVQVGFGLWSEYHIYDGPMILGKTFPSKSFQATFAKRMATCMNITPWMISVDAAGDHAPFAESLDLLSLPFGVFDDSFNHAKHQEENEPNWELFGRDRWKTAPAGGEFSFFEPKDQRLALAPKGPHGIPFEQQAAKFHVSFIIGDDQPRFQKKDRIREASLACGYRFRVTSFAASATASRVVIKNTGIAPIYYDAYPTVEGVRSATSLKGLLPGDEREFEIMEGGTNPKLTIESEHLVSGQRIEFEADLR